jgi:hypothetical protein
LTLDCQLIHLYFNSHCVTKLFIIAFQQSILNLFKVQYKDHYIIVGISVFLSLKPLIVLLPRYVSFEVDCLQFLKFLLTNLTNHQHPLCFSRINLLLSHFVVFLQLACYLLVEVIAE